MALKEIVSAISGGTPTKSVPKYWDGNIPWTSPKDFKDFYLYDAEDHISEDGLQAAGLKLIPVDTVLVVVRSGILIHTLPIMVTKVPTAINQDIKALLPKTDINSEYLGLYLEIFGSKLLPVITKHSTTVQSVNTDQFEELLIPLPDLNIQRALVVDMESARLARQEKLSQADELLKGIDGFVLEQLGLKLPKEENKPSFAIRFNAVQDGRVDPHFHHPSFVKSNEIIKTVTHKKLGQLAKFSNEIWSPEKETAETFQYIEISGVDIQTGNITATETLVSEAASRARMLTRNDDILISLTRPHRGAIAQVNQALDGCVASTGFSIIREITDKQITKDYLWCILRNQVSLQQMLQRSSGGNYPAITETELQKILIPIPSEKIQEKISSELSRRRTQADTLREEAEREWQNAKEKFEKALLE